VVAEAEAEEATTVEEEVEATVVVEATVEEEAQVPLAPLEQEALWDC